MTSNNPKPIPKHHSRQIPREELKTYPVYPGLPLAQITLVENAEQLAAALADLQSNTIIGFDTESRPTFQPGQQSDGPHLLQLASPTHAWLFPVQQYSLPEALKALLESGQITLVGFETGEDVRRLRERLGVCCASVLDAGTLFASEKRITVGAVQAVARVFGQYLRKSKKVTTSNWAKLPYSDAQLSYAGNDAWVPLQVYQALRA
ncbi:3'-5' exonuclease [Chitinilyticum litopenaei]|uniref:3'-5' exonuclease n=1 Tax=Chitinilyticum litopenaei TaxID=1121276 RepID=UPI0003F7CE51|nr:3'-5' exonuclease [Chitinilyticum litopenaei]